MPQTNPELSVVIPVYNEGENIRKTIEELASKVHHTLEALVVYDFDEDTTVAAVQRLQREYPWVRLVKNRHGRGALNAIRTGLESIEADVGIVVMADMADDLAAVDAMMEKRREGFDVVCGSRYMPGGRQIGGPILKGALSRTAGMSLKWLAGIPTSDVTNSFKLYSREVLRQIPVQSDGGFEIGMELVVKAHAAGFRVCEVPSVWKDRTAGESRFQLRRWIPKYLRWYVYALWEGNKRRLRRASGMAGTSAR